MNDPDRAGEPARKRLLPARILPQHRTAEDARMLALETCRRVGEPLAPADLADLEIWLAKLDEAGAIVAYHPDTERGWSHEARHAGDTDIVAAQDETIRVPHRAG